MDQRIEEVPVKRYWYAFYYYECVMCGRHRSYRERQYTPKPEAYHQRHHFSQYACGCHFM